MKKAVIASEGYLKQCIICGEHIENQMYETVTYTRGRMGYFHVTCYTKIKRRNRRS